MISIWFMIVRGRNVWTGAFLLYTYIFLKKQTTDQKIRKTPYNYINFLKYSGRFIYLFIFFKKKKKERRIHRSLAAHLSPLHTQSTALSTKFCSIKSSNCIFSISLILHIDKSKPCKIRKLGKQSRETSVINKLFFPKKKVNAF